ncbi:hypothetical protein [Escherichia coli]|uniref:hypothetical protein n=1 Tax=Escherichia coli TaxID=562 RepID=UPI000AB076CA|nr:hypothetical protein [Escherichia coli]
MTLQRKTRSTLNIAAELKRKAEEEARRKLEEGRINVSVNPQVNPDITAERAGRSSVRLSDAYRITDKQDREKRCS